MAEYDPGLHIMAGELRAGGIQIDKEIPDFAWVPRSSVRYEIEDVEESAETPKHVLPDLSFKMCFDEPFRWCEIKMNLPVSGESGKAK